MSHSIYALPCRTPVDWRLTGLKPAVRVIGEGMMWLGGGILFAATVYVMAALPGLIE